MAKDQIEVEVKSLLGSKENADALKAGMQKLDPNCVLVSSNSQLNHYFEGGDIKKLAEVFTPFLKVEAVASLTDIAMHGHSLSIRTREVDGVVKLVVKASLGSDSSSNGVARKEIEEVIEGKSLQEVDDLVLSAGYKYQAKWSRQREEFSYKGANVCLDKNAGYGYLAEFEKVVDETHSLEDVRKEIDSLMQELSVFELPQERLERMFAFYNEHWPEYYGTDNIFVIE